MKFNEFILSKMCELVAERIHFFANHFLLNKLEKKNNDNIHAKKA